MSQIGVIDISNDVRFLTGNIGGFVGQDLNDNINVIGAKGIFTSGDPLTYTLTITQDLALIPDAGVNVVSDINGHFTISGGQNIATNGVGVNNLQINVSGTTDHAIQLGNATGSLTSLAIGTTGVILAGVTGANPTWTTATYPATVAQGDLLCATAANVIGVVPAVATVGLVLTNNGITTAPTYQILPGGALLWSREAGAAVAAANGHGYIPTNVGLTTITLPATAPLGTAIAVMGESAAGWTIAQNAGQNIQYGNVSTTVGVGGTLSSSNRYDVVYIICRVADTTWQVLTAVGVLNVV